MFKKCLIIVLVIGFIFGSFKTALAAENKLKKESEIKICSELFLKKGTIVRTSNFSVLSNSNNPTEPKYENLFTSNKNNIVIQLNEDLQIYLTNGGFYTNKYTTMSDYLEDMKTIGYKTESLSVHLINQNEILRLQLERSKQMEKYYMSCASSYSFQIVDLKKQIQMNNTIINLASKNQNIYLGDLTRKYFIPAGFTVVGPITMFNDNGTVNSLDDNYGQTITVITFESNTLIQGSSWGGIFYSKEDALKYANEKANGRKIFEFFQSTQK